MPTCAREILRTYNAHLIAEYYRKQRIFLHFTRKLCIKVPYYESFYNFILKSRSMIKALGKTFKESALGKAAMVGAIALPLTLTSFGPAANNAHAGEANAATITDEQAIGIANMHHEMREYSEDRETKGIGIFINLQANASMEQGEKLAAILQNAFKSQGVPTEYRINQSQGTATGVTFYVNGYDFMFTAGQLKENLGRVLAHHQDEWSPQQVSLNTEPSQ